MLESGVDSGREHQIRRTQLLDPPQALEVGCIDQLDFERIEFDVAMNGVSQQLGHRHQIMAFIREAVIIPP